MRDEPRVVDPPCIVHPEDEVPATIKIPKEDAEEETELGVIAERTARNWGYQIVDVESVSVGEEFRLDVIVKAK